MSRTFEAVYDGKTFHPDRPLDLKPNSRVRLTLEDPAAPDAVPPPSGTGSWWQSHQDELQPAMGLWKDRTDLPSLEELRSEWDRRAPEP